MRSRPCDCSRVLPATLRHPIAMDEWCIAEEQVAYVARSMFAFRENMECGALRRHDVGPQTEGSLSSPLHWPVTAVPRHYLFELDAGFLHLAIRQHPYQRFIVKVDHLNAISPWIAKIAAKRWFQFDFVFPGQFRCDLLKLRLVANHDPEMPHVCPLSFVDFENRQELVLTQFEERVALAATHLFEIKNVLVKGHGLFNVFH